MIVESLNREENTAFPMDRNQLIKIVFLCLASLIVISLLLEVIAMIYYPGGCSVAIAAQDRFDFVWNTLTDLGRDVTQRVGLNNLISQTIYRIAILIMSVFGIVYHSIIWKYYIKNRINKYLVSAGTFLGIAQAGLYISVLFVLQEWRTHNKLIAAAAGSLIAAVLLYMIASFRNKDLPKIIKWTYFAIFTLAVIYAIIVLTGVLIHNAGVSDVLYYASQRIGHTLFNWILSILFIILSVGFFKFEKDKENLIEEINKTK